MPLISIIVPLYNCESYIEACLVSLQKQELQDFEVLIIDDGSQDSGPQICQSFCNGDSRFKLIRQNNQGVSNARNNGLSLAQGDFVAFLDADDWVNSDLYLRMVSSIQTSLADMVIAGIIFDFPDQSMVHPLPFSEGVIEKQQILDQFIPALLSGRTTDGKLTGCYVGTALYRKNALKKHNIRFHAELKRSEDPLFLLEAAFVSQRITVLQTSGYHYRKNNLSVSQKFGTDFMEQWLLAQPYFYQFAPLNSHTQTAYLDRLFLSMSAEFKNYSREGTPFSFWGQRLKIKQSLRSYWNQALICQNKFKPSLRYQKVIHLLAKFHLYTALAFIYWYRNKLQKEAIFT